MCLAGLLYCALFRIMCVPQSECPSCVASTIFFTTFYCRWLAAHCCCRVNRYTETTLYIYIYMTQTAYIQRTHTIQFIRQIFVWSVAAFRTPHTQTHHWGWWRWRQIALNTSPRSCTNISFRCACSVHMPFKFFFWPTCVLHKWNSKALYFNLWSYI